MCRLLIFSNIITGELLHARLSIRLDLCAFVGVFLINGQFVWCIVRFFDHPWSGVVHNMITLESLYVDSLFSLVGIFQGYTAQVLIWRSPGHGQGHWSEKRLKSLFLLGKSSIGNNPSSIKHTAMKFARSMGFSDMGDRMVWPQGPHYLTIMKPPLNLPLKMAEWQ